MSDWTDEEFGDVHLGDQRLNRRLRRLLLRKWENPQRSLSAGCQGRAEVEAASRFFDNPKAHLDKILAPHRAATLARIRLGGYRRVLLVQDTSEGDYTTHPALQGAGPLSSQDRRGFFIHNLLVVTPERVPLGLWHTFIYARDDAEHGKAATRKERPIEQKESFRWIEGYREACALAGLLPACEVLCLADRECDIYELFVEYDQRCAQGLPVAELLIRSNQDRCLEPFEAEAATAAGSVPPPPAPKKIRARLAAATVLGHVAFDVPAATRLKKTKGKCPKPVHRSARHVEQEVRAVPIRLKPPWRSPAVGGALPAVELWVVEARDQPPAGEEPLVWVLLTTLPVATSAQAVELLELYLCRWEIVAVAPHAQERLPRRGNPAALRLPVRAGDRVVSDRRLAAALCPAPGPRVPQPAVRRALRGMRMEAGGGRAQRPRGAPVSALRRRNGEYDRATGRSPRA